MNSSSAEQISYSRNNEVNRSRIEEISYIRGIAMLAVVLIHISVVAYRAVDVTSNAYPFYMFMNRFFRFGTPTFIFITGLVMFYGYYHKEINAAFLKTFYRNRLLYIFVPYFVWVVLYQIYRVSTVPNLPIESKDYWYSFIGSVFQGTSYYHFYFFFVLIQFYLLFPVMLYMVKKWKWFGYSLPILGLVVQLTMYITNFYFRWMPTSSTFFASFFLYFCVGGFIGIYYEKIISYLKKSYVMVLTVFMITFGSLYVWLFHLMLSGDLQMSPLTIEYMYFAFAAISAITLLGFTKYFVKDGPSWINKPLKSLGQYSFGIFLIHPMVINLLDYVMIWPGSRVFHVGIGLRFIFTILISYFLIYLIRRFLSFSALVVGK